MKILVQSVKTGALRFADVAPPAPNATSVLVRTTRSTISSGTERSVRELASASLLQKAKQRPDLVRKVVDKARTDGVRSALDAVQSRLDDEMPLGYSGVGIATEVGEFVSGVQPGQRVATGGAGHGEFQTVAGMLAVPVPDGVSDANAAMATVGAIALHGFRQGSVDVGGHVCVIGLGLVGQIATRLAQAAGCSVSGIDIDPAKLELAAANGVAVFEDSGDASNRIRAWSRGRGVDAVLICAATKSSAPVERATTVTRDRGEIVIVGDVGLELDRRPFYENELGLRFARSYGPGRYDRSYEDWAVDYPIGHVRWTEGRNIESFLDLVDQGRLDVSDLVSHTYPFNEATDAYELISERPGDVIGLQLLYPSDDGAPVEPRSEPTRVPGASPSRPTNLGLIGAGNFVRATLVGAIEKSGLGPIVSVTSAGGLSAQRLAQSKGIPSVAPDVDTMLADPSVHIAVVATRHRSHAELTKQALQAGRDVFCEKPLALSTDELEDVWSAWQDSGRHLAVGFNRRHAPVWKRVRDSIPQGTRVTMTYRVNAGSLPADHWYFDRTEGGRLLGEVCHFIDTCNYLASSEVASIFATGDGQAELSLQQDINIVIRYKNGSLATVVYACEGHPKMPKERIEVIGGGHSAVVDDYRNLDIDGERVKMTGQDKGHDAQLSFFRRQLDGSVDAAAPTLAAFETMRTCFAAIESLQHGRPVHVHYPTLT